MEITIKCFVLGLINWPSRSSGQPLIKELLLSELKSIVHEVVVVLFHHMAMKLPVIVLLPALLKQKPSAGRPGPSISAL